MEQSPKGSDYEEEGDEQVPVPQNAPVDFALMFQTLMNKLDDQAAKLDTQKVEIAEISNKFDEQKAQNAEMSNKLDDQAAKLDTQKVEMANKFDEQKAQNAEMSNKSAEQIAEMSNRSAEQIAEMSNKLEAQMSNKLDEQAKKFEEQTTILKTELMGHVQNLEIKMQKQMQACAQSSNKLNETMTQISQKLETRIDMQDSKLSEIAKLVEVKSAEHAQMTERLEKSFEVKMQMQENQQDERHEQIKTSLQEVTDKGLAVCRRVSKLETRVNSEMKEMNSQIHEIKSDSTNLSAKVKNVEIASQKNMELQLQQMREQLQDEIRDVAVSAGRSGGGGGSSMPSPPPELIFTGRENPRHFLRLANDYLDLHKEIPEIMKPKCIQQMMRESAAMWLMTLVPFPKNMKEFTEKFLNRFWDQHSRYEFERKLMDDRWYEQSGISMLDFCTRQLFNFRLLDSSMSDQKLIWLIASQYPLQTRNLLNSVPINSLEHLQELVSKYDRARAQAQRSYNNNQNYRYNGNWNHNNHDRHDNQQHYQYNRYNSQSSSYHDTGQAQQPTSSQQQPEN